MSSRAATVAGRARVAPRIPRRVSGPGRTARRPASTKPSSRTRTAAPQPFALRVLARLQALADSRLLDRLVRGRLWIPLVAAALVGVVFMQVSMLRLNAGIGTDVEAIGKLERENSVMQADVSRMEAGERIQSVARGLGMVVPAAGSFHYVQAGEPRAGALAAARMQPPDPEALARAQQETAAQSEAAAPAAATPAAPATTTATPPTSTTTATAPATTTPAAPPAATTSAPPASTPSTTASAPVTPAAAPSAASGGAAAPSGGQQ